MQVLVENLALSDLLHLNLQSLQNFLAGEDWTLKQRFSQDELPLGIKVKRSNCFLFQLNHYA